MYLIHTMPVIMMHTRKTRWAFGPSLTLLVLSNAPLVHRQPSVLSCPVHVHPPNLFDPSLSFPFYPLRPLVFSSVCFVSLQLGTRSSPPGASNCCHPPRYSIALKHPLLVIFNPYSKRRRPPDTCQKPQFQSFYFFCFLTCPKAYFILRSMPHPVLLASP